jgi:epoxyqueuosine reductase
MDLRETIYQAADQLGFDAVGVASAATPLPHAGFLSDWLALGYHGEMSYLAKDSEKRRDIRLWYPEAQSVIVVAHNYYTPYPHVEEKSYGKIARYAWGRDYHKVVARKLKLLLVAMQQADSKLCGRFCVDTAPVMEKLWAVAAGLGWQGKHSNIISPRYGSWIFLGLVAINRELASDAPLPDRCGSCSACLTACPTRAIVAPYVVDARLCLSYLTIELRDAPLPSDVAAIMNRWVFGCDICQNVCPWNRKLARPTQEADYEPRPGSVEPLLRELLALDEAAFAKRFAGTPVMRAKWRNFKRNVMAALGDEKFLRLTRL